MKRILGIFLLIFLFSPIIFGQVVPIKGASISLTIPAAGLPQIIDFTFTHTAAAGTSSFGTVFNATLTEPIDISWKNFQTTLIEIYSATRTSGAIGGVSYAVCLTGRTDIVSPTEIEPSVFLPVKSLAADAIYWATLPYMTDYGRYEIPLAGADKLYLWGGGTDRVQRKVRFSLR